MHNWPGVPTGSFAIRSGPFFAATDIFEIKINGRGGHAAKPQETVDPTVLASHMVLALQTIASRNARPGQVHRRLGHQLRNLVQGVQRHPRHRDAQGHRPHPRPPRSATSPRLA